MALYCLRETNARIVGCTTGRFPRIRPLPRVVRIHETWIFRISSRGLRHHTAQVASNSPSNAPMVQSSRSCGLIEPERDPCSHPRTWMALIVGRVNRPTRTNGMQSFRLRDASHCTASQGEYFRGQSQVHNACSAGSE